MTKLRLTASHFACPALLLAALFASGCGAQGYVPASTSAAQSAPGSFTVPAKVDVLLVEDDTGSMSEAYDAIAADMPQFLSGISGKGWDYHFATIPLTTRRPVAQVQASKHDGNWGAQWTPPYPGALINGPGTVSSGAFRFPENYADFLPRGYINNSLGGMEPGFSNLLLHLQDSQMKSTGFMRPDALLAVVVVGNGNDTSGVTFCKRSDGYTVPCEDAGKPGTQASSFNSYLSQFQAIKNAGLMRFYAAVATTASYNCKGGAAYTGTRYMQMAAALNGASFDICSNSVSSVLSSLDSNLQSVKIAMRSRYLFIEKDANVSTIVVTRNDGVTIPQDTVNGWTYAGYVNNVYAVDYPAPMNLASGWAIELHGNYKLVGDQTATVTFQAAGATAAAK
jgi:hypothetical protein